MNPVSPHGLTTLTLLCVLAVTPLSTGCGAAPGSSPGHKGTGQPGAAAGSSTGGCTALLGAHQPASTDYPRIRSQFAHSPWPDLYAAGTAYVDLIVKLQTARNTDGYQAVWFHQRLALACTRHGWKQPPAHQRPGHLASSRESSRPANP